MCTPALAVALGAIAVGTQTAGAITGARAQNKAAEFNAEVGHIQALEAAERGLLTESQFRTSVGQLQGKQRVGFAGAGVSVASGSAFDILAETTKIGNLDAMTIRHNTAKEVAALEAGASLAASATRSPLLAGGGTLLTGASSLMTQFSAFNTKFAPSNVLIPAGI